MTQEELLAFARTHRWALAATVSASGEPHGSVIGFAATDSFEIVFDTVEVNRKAGDLRRDSRIAIAIGWDDGKTLQIEGMADEPSGHELECVKKTYFDFYPEYCRKRQAIPGLTYFRVRPTWMRFSDFSESPASVVICDPATGMMTHSTRRHLSDGY